MIQDARNQRRSERVFGSVSEERISGRAGRRKRGSWWGIRERKAVPDSALRRGILGIESRVGKSRRRAGPRRRGRETRKCV